MRLDVEELATIWDSIEERGIRKAIAKKEKALQEHVKKLRKSEREGHIIRCWRSPVNS
jgi:hypothetical protein